MLMGRWKRKAKKFFYMMVFKAHKYGPISNSADLHFSGSMYFFKKSSMPSIIEDVLCVYIPLIFLNNTAQLYMLA